MSKEGAGISLLPLIMEGHASREDGSGAREFTIRDWQELWSIILPKFDEESKVFCYRWILLMARLHYDDRLETMSEELISELPQHLIDLLSLTQQQLIRAAGGFRNFILQQGTNTRFIFSSDIEVIILELEDDHQTRINIARGIYSGFKSWCEKTDTEGLTILDRAAERKKVRPNGSLFDYGYSRDVANLFLGSIVGFKNYEYPSVENNFQGVLPSHTWGTERARHRARFYPEGMRCFYEFLVRFSDQGSHIGRLMERNNFDEAMKFFRERTMFLREQYNLRREFPIIIPTLENDLRIAFEDPSISLG